MVDVAHDGDHRRARLEIFRVVLFGRELGQLGGVLGFPNRLEPELRRDQFDLVEVEPLVDRDHHAQLLESELDDLGGRDLHGGRELRDRDELVDPDPGLFALTLLGPALRHLIAVRRLVGTARGPSGRRPFMP